MNGKRPAADPRPSTSRGQTGPVNNDSSDSDAHVPPSMDHGLPLRPVIRPAPWVPPGFRPPRPENLQAAPRPGIQAGVLPRPDSLPPGPAPNPPLPAYHGPAPERPGEARPQIEVATDVSSDQGDANVQVIKDDHEELPNDANIDNGGGRHEADQGDYQEADVIALHDYAVAAVKDDEVLHDESETPVGEQAAASNVDVNISEGAVHDHHQAAGDVNGDDDPLVDAIAEQPAVNVDDVTTGDGLSMHNGNQGADAIVEVVNKDDEVHGEPVLQQLKVGDINLDIVDGGGIVHNAAGDQAGRNNNMVQPELKLDDEVDFPPLGQQPQQQRRRQADPPRAQEQQQHASAQDGSPRESTERRAVNLIDVIVHEFAKRATDDKKEGN